MPNLAETLSLRTAAKQLAGTKRQKGESIAVNELLNLLRTGQVSAGVRFGDGLVNWINLPATFWGRVKSSEFNRIRRSGTDKERRGMFTVTLAQIADPYLDAVKSAGKARKGSEVVLGELEKVVRTETSLEVELLESDWQSYLQSCRIKKSDIEWQESRGAPRKEGWRELCWLVAVHMLAKHRNDKPRDMNAESIAKDIYAAALKREIPGLPKEATIKDEVISKIIGELRNAQG